MHLWQEINYQGQWSIKNDYFQQKKKLRKKRIHVLGRNIPVGMDWIILGKKCTMIWDTYVWLDSSATAVNEGIIKSTKFWHSRVPHTPSNTVLKKKYNIETQ